MSEEQRSGTKYPQTPEVVAVLREVSARMLEQNGHLLDLLEYSRASNRLVRKANWMIFGVALASGVILVFNIVNAIRLDRAVTKAEETTVAMIDLKTEMAIMVETMKKVRASTNATEQKLTVVEEKVDTAPKIIADKKGGLKLAVPMAHDRITGKAPPRPSASAEIPLEAPVGIKY